MPTFEDKLREYADLLVRVGLNIKKDQPVSLVAQIAHADLARMCVEMCYKAGAKTVQTMWRDEIITKYRFLYDADELFDTVPEWQIKQYESFVDEEWASLHIAGSDPENLKECDPMRMQRSAIASGKLLEKYQRAMMASAMQWCIGAYATPSWARVVFPDLPVDEAVAKLWDAIFTCCRVEGDGKAVERWREHIASLKAKAEIMNGYAFDRLVYKNSLGTNLTVGLPEGHIWTGAAEMAGTGVEFTANIPTEELFTAPHMGRADGVVYASMPLELTGNIVKDIVLTLKDGVIVDAKASEGESFLLSSLDTDEGARRLGEVALVPYSSPIRKSCILYFNTLFDENASCHFAFGEAYPTTVAGAEGKSRDEQKAMGINQSYTHVDFMVGTADLSIVGITKDGREVAVFVDGEYAI